MHWIAISHITMGHKPIEGCLQPARPLMAVKIVRISIPRVKNLWVMITVPTCFSMIIAVGK